MAENKAIMPMADYTAICDAVREKKGTADTYKSGELATAISSIEGGGGGGNTFTGHVDAEGLSAIGWTAEEIARFQQHVWWDEEDDDLWSVATNGEEAFPISNSNASSKSIAMVIRIQIGNTTYSWRSFQQLRYLDLTNASTKGNTHRYFMYHWYRLEKVIGFSNLFNNMTDLTDFENSFNGLLNLDIIDLGEADTSLATNLKFASLSAREIRGVLDLTSNNATDLFPAVSSSFVKHKTLVKAKIKNPTVSLDLSYTLLDHESLLYLLNNLQEKEGLTLTLGEDLLAKLTDDEKAIATNKGWTLA